MNNLMTSAEIQSVPLKPFEWTRNSFVHCDRVVGKMNNTALCTKQSAWKGFSSCSSRSIRATKRRTNAGLNGPRVIWIFRCLSIAWEFGKCDGVVVVVGNDLRAYFHLINYMKPHDMGQGGFDMGMGDTNKTKQSRVEQNRTETRIMQFCVNPLFHCIIRLCVSLY